MHTHAFTLALLAATASSAIVSQFSGPGRLTGTNFGIPGRNATYDYIIVGGGTAGSVVAARLTEHTNASVALIETGSFTEFSNGNWSQIPYWSEQWVGAEQDEWQPLIDWGLFTEPQISGERVHYAQGKGLGGSSTRNQMMYHRPSKGSLDVWAERVGDESWAWEGMKKYYERSMRFDANAGDRAENGSQVFDAGAFGESDGNSQPLRVSYPGYVNPLSRYAAAAFEAIGLKRIPGFASGVLSGFGWWQFTIDSQTGLRSSAEASFLAEALGRPKLTTYINAQAKNILFENGTATAVDVTNYGMRPFTLLARKEVIVSAGPWHSPQLLMVSGVGPKATLDEFGIEVVKDLPGVGQNMWDSTSLGGPVYEVSPPGYTYWQQEGPMASAEAQLLLNGTGPLTNIGLDIGAWETFPDRSNFSTATQEALAGIPADWPLIENSLTSSSRVLESSDSQKQYGVIGCILVAATSRGNMTIQSADNMDPPIIDPGWLREESDQEIAVEAYRRARKAWQAVPDGIRIGSEVSPGANVTTNAQLLDYIKQNISPIHHASSSCAMGKSNDTMAVVDSKGRVFGVQRLRVIDSSSFPFTPPGHTQGVTYAHAEKLVDDVLEDYFAGDAD